MTKYSIVWLYGPSPTWVSLKKYSQNKKNLKKILLWLNIGKNTQLLVDVLGANFQTYHSEFRSAEWCLCFGKAWGNVCM